MAYCIRQVDKNPRRFRISIPNEIIRELGWEKVRYVRMHNAWGDRVVIERVADDEEDKTHNKRDKHVDN